MKLRALTVGESVILGSWMVTRNRVNSYTLHTYPVKQNSRTRFGTLAEIRADLEHIEQTGDLPPIVRGWA